MQDLYFSNRLLQLQIWVAVHGGVGEDCPEVVLLGLHRVTAILE